MNFILKSATLPILAAICWGVVYALHHLALEKISPLKLLLYGGILDVVIIIPILLIKGESILSITALESKSLVYIAASMLVALVANILILYSIKNLGANTAAVLEISYPVFTAIVLFLLIGEKLDTRFLAGACLILIGASLVVTRSPETTYASVESSPEHKLASKTVHLTERSESKPISTVSLQSPKQVDPEPLI